MKYCINCGKEMKDDGKFCPNCGQDQTAAVNNDSEQSSIADNQTVQQTVALGKNYWKYFLGKLAWPTAKTSDEPLAFGYISVGLYAVLQGFLITLLVSHGLNMVDALLNFFDFDDSSMQSMPNMGSMFQGVSFSFFLRTFIIFLLMAAVTIGVLFGIEKITLKTTPDFHQTVLQVGNFLNVINLILLVFSLCLFIQLFSVTISILVLLMASIFFQLALILVINYNARNANCKIAPFYIILLFFVVNALASGILFTMVVA